MTTKTDRLRKGLIALGFKPVESRSSRECFTKRVTLMNRETGVKREGDYYVWLFTGTLRAGSEPTIGSAQACSDAFIAKVLAAADRAPDFF